MVSILRKTSKLITNTQNFLRRRSIVFLGVQWHPERGWKDDPFASFAKALFTTFIDQARLRYNRL